MRRQLFYSQLYELPCMSGEIQKVLLEIEINTKYYRRVSMKGIKKWGAVFFGYLAFSVVICVSYPILIGFWFMLSFLVETIPAIAFWGGVYYYIRPYYAEEKAFRKMASALEMLEKSNESITYKEAYRCLSEACRILKKIQLHQLGWYSDTNKTLKRFLENFELTVLPATSEAKIKREHLEQMALAVLSRNPLKIKAINEVLEASYKKEEKPLRKPVFSWKELSESKFGRILVSLCLGYGLVLVLCVAYVFMTQQDLATFARERPDVIILGGLFISGITFWKKD